MVAAATLPAVVVLFRSTFCSAKLRGSTASPTLLPLRSLLLVSSVTPRRLVPRELNQTEQA